MLGPCPSPISCFPVGQAETSWTDTPFSSKPQLQSVPWCLSFRGGTDVRGKESILGERGEKVSVIYVSVYLCMSLYYLPIISLLSVIYLSKLSICVYFRRVIVGQVQGPGKHVSW